MLLGTLGVSLLGNVLKGQAAIAKSVSEETRLKRPGRGILRTGYGNKKVRKTLTKNKKNF